MKTIFEFRVWEEHASLIFKDNEGTRLGKSIRKIMISPTDKRFTEIGLYQNELKKNNQLFYSSWNVRRYATHGEIAQANLFNFNPTRYFEPFGEECGTVYDDSVACPQCGCGARQIGPLFMRASRIPKADIASTMAPEIVVSRRLVESFQANDVTGAIFTPVQTNKRGGGPSEQWFQMTVALNTAEVIPPTQTGNGPFDLDPENKGRCPIGPLAGLNLLSDITIQANTWGTFDIMGTRQFFGWRRIAGTSLGMLRPHPEILVSQKVRRLIEAETLKGVRLEVAYLG